MSVKPLSSLLIRFISLECMFLLLFVRDGIELRRGLVSAPELGRFLAYVQAPEMMSAPGPFLFQTLPPTVLSTQ